jgi:hypothetical protein
MMSYSKRFCPTCGVDQPSLERRCVFCGSPVRVVTRERSRVQSQEQQQMWERELRSIEEQTDRKPPAA